MESKGNIGDIFDVNPHRVDELLVRARACYDLSKNASDYMKLIELDEIYHDGERQLLIYFFGSIRGAEGLAFAVGKLPWYTRLRFFLNPSLQIKVR